jgi:hypothetical protein
VVAINDMAFEGCRSIHSIELSPKLQTINISAFNKADNFTRFIEGSNKYYNTHNGILYSKNKNTLYYCPQGYYGTCVTNHETKIINSYAFYGCNKIQHVIMNGIEEIKDYAFKSCTNLKKITLAGQKQRKKILFLLLKIKEKYLKSKRWKNNWKNN